MGGSERREEEGRRKGEEGKEGTKKRGEYSRWNFSSNLKIGIFTNMAP